MKARCYSVISIFFLALAFAPTHAQTTVILLRHAEKLADGSSDPGLSGEGKKRALELVRVLANVKIDAIYTTPFNRTKQTVAPLAESKQLEIQEYNPFKLEEIVEEITSAGNKTLVFSGHSNTTPIFVNLLLGSETYKQLNEKDYDNLYIVSLYADAPPKVLELAYGEASVF